MFRCYSDPYYNRGAQYLDPEEHLLPYWGEQQLVRKGKRWSQNLDVISESVIGSKGTFDLLALSDIGTKSPR
jgi:hypothetical protein